MMNKQKSAMLCFCTKSKPILHELIQSRINSEITVLPVFTDDLTGDLTDKVKEIQTQYKVLGIVNRTGSVTSSLIDALPDLKIAISHGSGYNEMSVESATKAKVWVANVPGGNARSVAELTVMFAISLLRKAFRAGNFLKDTVEARNTRGSELRGKKVGIVGYGKIGALSAALFSCFGAEVLIHSRRVERIPEEFRIQSLSELYQTCDIVTLHLPLMMDTKNMINSEALNKFKKGAFLINTSRAGLIDHSALVQSMRLGHLGGVALDFIPNDVETIDALEVFDNAILTPHIGGDTEEALVNIAETASEEMCRVLNGISPRNAINDIS